MEDLVARIDTPLLDDLTVIFIHQGISGSPQLIQFIDRTPRLQPHNQACIVIAYMRYETHLAEACRVRGAVWSTIQFARPNVGFPYEAVGTCVTLL
jgi:hypothetical protein